MRVDSCGNTGLKISSSLRISMEYIGPWVLAQQRVLLGVLAQVTKLSPRFRAGRSSKYPTLNEFWSHPPGSNRRPADYEPDDQPPSCSVCIVIRPSSALLGVQFGGFWMGIWMGNASIV